MSSKKTRPAKKKIKLALQGGGSHGAYAWGVIDALMEDGRIEVEAIVGTSAGAMNAVVTTCGLIQGGPDHARKLLAEFWRRVSQPGAHDWYKSYFKLNEQLPFGNVPHSFVVKWIDTLTRIFSPYELNPLNINPLRDLLNELIDFDAVQGGADRCKLFVAATNVLSGRLRIFEQQEITIDAVLASASLPNIFPAVEINEESFWDGGYMGNPPIFPLIYDGSVNDVLIIQINPINISSVPKTATEIADRINTLSFNSSLMREMRAIHFVNGLVHSGELSANKYARINIHVIDAETELMKHGMFSKTNTDWEFLNEHFEKIGHESSTDIRSKFL
jgi:NTE family protein